MAEEKQYGIIREQGEFMEPAYLNDNENTIVNNNDSKKDENN